MRSLTRTLALFIIVACCSAFIIEQASAPRQQQQQQQQQRSSSSRRLPSSSLFAEKGGGFFQGVSKFLEELDNFVDDATARRLGNGAAFYGKRKSSFYGKKDKNRKKSSTPDPTEDYQAPAVGGYFQWMPDENGQMRPVSRMKKKIIERNPSFWDRVYEKEEEWRE